MRAIRRVLKAKMLAPRAGQVAYVDVFDPFGRRS